VGLGLWGLMDTSHRIVLPAVLKQKTSTPKGKYFKIEDVSDTAYYNVYGIADTTGKILVPTQYRFIEIKSNYFEAIRYSSARWKLNTQTDIFNKFGKKVLSFEGIENIWNENEGVFKSYLVVQSENTLEIYKVNWETAESSLFWSQDSSYFRYADIYFDSLQSKNTLHMTFTSSKSHYFKNASTYFDRIEKGWRTLLISENGIIKDEESDSRLIITTRNRDFDFEPKIESKLKKIEHGIILMISNHRNKYKRLFKVVSKRKIISDKDSSYEGNQYDTSASYNEIRACELGYFVSLNKRWGLMDFNFKLIVPIQFEDIMQPNFKFYEPFGFSDTIKEEYLILVKQNSVWGIFTLFSNGFLIPCVYDSIISVSRDKYIVKLRDLWGAVDIENSELVPYIFKNLVFTNQFPVFLVDRDYIILAGYVEGRLSLYSHFNGIQKFDLDSVVQASKDILFLYKNEKVAAYCMFDSEEILTPFLKSEFKITNTKLSDYRIGYYWLETNDKQTAGYIREDGKYYFILD
jgi:hypothetical protein